MLGSGDRPEPSSRFEVDSNELFARTRRNWYLVACLFWIAFFLLAGAVFSWFAGSDGNVVVWLGIPGPGLLMVAVGIGGAVVLSVVPNLNRRAAMVANRSDVDLYGLGPSPFTRTFVGVADGCILVIDRRGELLESWRKESLDAVALRQFGSAVSMVLFSNDRCFELSIPSKLGGPAAPVWSAGGALGQSELCKTIGQSLRRHGYPFTIAGRPTRADDPRHRGGGGSRTS
ncbi:hypothetical protein [Agromyces mariniharenae]|uniref:Uncharacterized protein n=1 Tax=Agromyces mariniharenae TaxID=2604423 RepID=A0A5S4V639_9MICO|nr:hypothetical protein [Agromyces mariniharenae]TYL53313.1 hypothetical protein FYC51_06400 [Agromyces mariniharenae]